MNTTLFEDLVNYKEIAKGIAKLEAANVKFADSAVTQNERIGKSMQELAREAAGLREQITGFSGGRKGSSDSGLQGLKDDVKKLTQAEKDYQAVLGRNKQLVDLNTASIDAMKKRMADLNTEYNKLDNSEAKSIARKKQIISEIKQTAVVLNAQRKVTLDAAKAADVANGSYNALDRQTQKLRADLKGLTGAFDPLTGKLNTANRAAVDLQKQIDLNSKALLNADRQMGQSQRNVGNYGSALKDIGGQLLGFTSIAGGIALAFEAIKMGVGIVQDMQRVDAGLKAVSRDSDDFAHSQQFLMGLADKLGLEYGDLADSYKSLKAATKDTALEGRNTEKMFSAVATAGAKLQLSNETVTGTLLALTQMISKGHIQAEELRGQLGERLPGALRLMSEALGVSETKLNVMMEQGQLIATEVMPKFADSLDKAYGLKQSEKIENLTANTSRFKNEVGYLLKAFDDTSGVTKFFSAITRNLADSLGDIRRWLKDGSVVELVTFFGEGSLTNRNQQRRNAEEKSTAFAKMTPKQRDKELKDLRTEELSLIEFGETEKAKTVSNLRRKLQGENVKLELSEMKDKRRQVAIAEKDAVEKNESDLARFQKQSVKKRTAEIIALEKQLASDPKNVTVKSKLDIYRKLDDEQKARDKAVKDRLAPDKIDKDSPFEKLDKQIKALSETLEKQILVGGVDPKLAKQLEELTEKAKNARAELDLIKETGGKKRITTDINKATTSDLDRIGERPYVSYRLDKKGQQMNEGEIRDADAKRLAELTNNLNEQLGITREYNIKRQRLEYDFNNDLSQLPQARKEAALNLLQEMEDAEKQGNKDELQRLKDKYAQMSEADRDYLSTKREIQEKYFEIGSTLINGLFEIEQQKNQNALVQVEKNKAYELSLVGDNEGAKAAIEQKYAAQSKQLQHQQDVANRNQALFQIAISTAVEVSKSLSKPGLAIAIALLGAVQAGIVLSKPLPQYADGKNVSDNYEGPAEVGEAGRELLFRDGRATLIDRPSIVDVKRNDVILPNHLTERMLNDERAWEANALLHRSMSQRRAVDAMSENRERYQVRMMASALGNGSPSAGAIGRAVGAEIGKLPFNHTTFDEKGVTDYVTQANHRKVVQKNKHQIGRKS